jgi:hypothetical protein
MHNPEPPFQAEPGQSRALVGHVHTTGELHTQLRMRLEEGIRCTGRAQQMYIHLNKEDILTLKFF